MNLFNKTYLLALPFLFGCGPDWNELDGMWTGTCWLENSTGVLDYSFNMEFDKEESTKESGHFTSTYGEIDIEGLGEMDFDPAEQIVTESFEYDDSIYYSLFFELDDAENSSFQLYSGVAVFGSGLSVGDTCVLELDGDDYRGTANTNFINW